MKILRFLWDFVFPPDCIICQTEGEILCSSCVQKIPRNCLYSFSSEYIKNIFVLGEYENIIVEKSIAEMKYAFAEDIGECLLPFFTDQLQKISIPPSAIFVPIPLHFLRLNERGFNQSEILARIFSKIFFPNEKEKVCNMLSRMRNTPHQAHLSPMERVKNVQSAFKIQKNNISKETPIFLVDDVASTLSTIHEATSTLRENGFYNISVIVLARSQQFRDKKIIANNDKT